MRIAITVDPEIPVPPIHYGGIERIVDMLVNEFLEAGHQVSIFAHKESSVKGKLIPYTGKNSNSVIDTLKHMHLIGKKTLFGDFDVVHSFSRLAYLSLVLPFNTLKIMSYQREPTISQIVKARKLAKRGSLFFTGCSDYITDQIKPFADAVTIYNGFPIEKYVYNYRVNEDAPLVFLGRIEPIKGVHNAIEIAKKANKKLVIAGNIPIEHELYFKEKINPFIDNQKVFYVGPVNDTQKVELLKSAAAFLMPIEWNEPFGIVMVEAMACGTPVIALSRGAVPEVIKHGVTGFICNTVEECIQKVPFITHLNRNAVRKEAVDRFSSKVIAANYLNLYQQLLEAKQHT